MNPIELLFVVLYTIISLVMASLWVLTEKNPVYYKDPLFFWVIVIIWPVALVLSWIRKGTTRLINKIEDLLF